MTLTAEPIISGQTAQRVASVKMEHSVTGETAAAAAYTVGLERPVGKEDLRSSPTATEETHRTTTHHSSTIHPEESNRDLLFTLKRLTGKRSWQLKVPHGNGLCDDEKHNSMFEPSWMVLLRISEPKCF